MAKGFDVAKWDAWRTRLATFDSWAGTVAEFCRHEGVSQASFYYWARRIRHADITAGETVDRSEPISLNSQAEVINNWVDVVVGDSIRVRMPAAQPEAVAALVRLLQDAPHAASSLAVGSPAATSRFQRIELTNSKVAAQR